VRRLLWSVLPVVAALAACQAKVDGGPGRTGSGGNGSSSGGGANGGGGSSTAGAPGSFGNLACSAPQLGSPVLRLLTATEFVNTVSDIFPQVTAGAYSNTLPGNTVSAYGFPNDASAVVGPQLAQALLDTATSLATALVGTPLATILPCSTTTPDRTCAETFVNQYGRRLFRRAVSSTEHDRYLTFFDKALSSSDFKTAIKWLAVGLIQSPNAIYRSEIGTDTGGTRNLSPDEIATEFAYTFTGTTPTDALLTQAESGTSVDAAGLAKTLLATDAGKLTMQHFFEAYLAYGQVASVERANISTFDSVRSDMVQETRTFINQVVVQNGGGLKDLLTAGTTNPSAQLATYYGFPAPSADFASLTRPAGRGIGLLAQGSILASRALPDSSSPTQRGLLVFTRLLCETKPTPPANVPPPPTVALGKVTTRERYENQHASSGVCASCHKLFDPIGFGFEHFDEGGRYRADEGGLAINTVSDVPNSDGTPMFQFQDQETLAQGLANQDLVYQCFAAYLATYAFGTADSCLGSSRLADLRAGTLSIADYYAALAAEPHFVQRSSQ
jgi:hypothetical protein